MLKEKQAIRTEPRIKNKFVLFSVILFAFILFLGSFTFILSMRQIIRTNKGIELSQILEIEKMWLEGTVSADITLVQKMANSPAILKHFENPEDESLKKYAIEEIDSFRRFFSDGYEVFWINDSDRIFNMDNSEAFLLDPGNPDNYWYNMTLYETEEYNFNINFNPDLESFKLWINAPVFDENNNPIGVLGTGIDLTAFTERIFQGMSGRGEMFFFNYDGEITGALDIDLVMNKTNIMEELRDEGVDILSIARGLYPGETHAFEVSRGEMAVGTIPLLDWYTIAFMPDALEDYFSPMTTLFLVVIFLILMIFIVFNVFISGFIKSLSKTMESLEVASSAKSTFLANMSHEIRTPMNAIIGITDIMMQNDDLPEEMTEGLSKIYGSCDLLLGIINDILDFSKIEAGKLDVIPSQYYVASLINSSVNLNMMRVGDKPIEFELEVEEDVPSKLIGDELRIKQILNNLLSNSFKYTDSGMITLSVSSELEESSDGVTLVLCVKDTGQGMTSEQLESLFEEYTRFNDDSIRAVEGTGLGLAITQRLLYLMDGQISVESEPGEGTTVTIRLPQGTVDRDILGKELTENLKRFYTNYVTHKKRNRIEFDLMSYGSVLIVDDVETNLYVAVGLMKLYGLQIDTAMSGYEAIEKVQSGRVYDVIFMDHMMPGMDGIETTEKMRESGYTDPIVALTANAVAGQADMFLQNGFDDFISKPIDLRQLNLILIKHIRSKQSPEVIAAARLNRNNKTSGGTDDMSTVNGADDKGISTKDHLLMESFIRDIEKTVKILEEQLGVLDFEDDEKLRIFIVTVHGIKSSLANLGEMALSKSAVRLEHAGRDKELDLIITEAPVFLGDLRALLLKIQPKQNNNEAGDDPEDIHDRIIAIKEMCADYNRKGTLTAISDIGDCSAQTRSVLEIIKEHVSKSEYEEAESAAALYADEISKES